MKKSIIYLLLSTGLSTVGLVLFYVIIREENIPIQTALQLLGANILIHLGLNIRGRFEIRSPMIESILDNTIIIIVLLIFRLVFGWFEKVPVWLLIISVIVLYIITIFITSSVIKKDIEVVNKLLDEQNQENKL
jgi:hypothetical protein